MSDPFDWLPSGWSDGEKQLWEDFDSAGAFDDQHAQALFHAAYFDTGQSPDDRAAIRDALEQYLMDTYGIEFDEVFDWDAWRELYEGEG